MVNLLRILVFLRPYKKHMLWLLFTTAVVTLINLFPPLVTKELIDTVFTQGRTEDFFFLSVLMIVVPMGVIIFGHLQRITMAYLGQHFIFDIRNSLYRHILGLSLRFYSQNSAGKIVYRLMGDSDVIQQLITGQAPCILADSVTASFAIFVTFSISWRLALLLLGILLVFVLNFRLTRKKIIFFSRSSRQAYDRLSGGVQNRLVANIAVKTFGAEARENATFHEQSAAALTFEKRQGISENNFWMNVNLIQSVGWSLIYFIGTASVLKGDMTYGEVTAFTAYTMAMLWPAVRFSQIVNQLQQVAISTDRLLEIFDAQPEIRDSADASPLPSPIRGEVELDNVQFHYEAGIPIIKGISIHCNPGDTIAFIGATGCGKTTILNLLMRFYDVIGGEIRLDGKDIRKIPLKQLRSQFGIVLQESLLFSVSIRENIRYARPDATMEEIIAAAKAAEIHDFIEKLPDGYETIVGDQGIELSVGQKQRINIARAICANPTILVMDEATSSLDSDSELAIQSALARVLKGRTSFIVAHRLSTIRNATQIILLDHGEIVEQGNHEQLMAIPNGRYHELYTKHMGKGVID